MRCVVCNRKIKPEESCRHPKCGEEPKPKPKPKGESESWAARFRDGMKIMRGDNASPRRKKRG